MTIQQRIDADVEFYKAHLTVSEELEKHIRKGLADKIERDGKTYREEQNERREDLHTG